MSKRLWRIDLERTQTATMYVLADSEKDAKEDAAELMYGADWDSPRPQMDVHHATRCGPNSLVWTGGPDGADIRGHAAVVAYLAAEPDDRPTPSPTSSENQ